MFAIAELEADTFVPGAASHVPVSGGPTASCSTRRAGGVPPGSGERFGVDRDGDAAWDGDERDACTDRADPARAP